MAAHQAPLSLGFSRQEHEWVAISFSNAWKWKVKVKSLSRVQPWATPWTAAHQAPPSMGFSRQESWSGVHCLLHMLSRLVITFLPRSKRLLISWLQSPSAVIWEPKKIKSDTVSPSISHEVMGPDAMIFKLFHSPLSLSSRGFLVPLHNLELRPLEAKSKTHSKSIPAPCAPPLAPALCRSWVWWRSRKQTSRTTKVGVGTPPSRALLRPRCLKPSSGCRAHKGCFFTFRAWDPPTLGWRQLGQSWGGACGWSEGPWESAGPIFTGLL